jgi:Tol biopolymer transport system component
MRHVTGRGTLGILVLLLACGCSDAGGSDSSADSPAPDTLAPPSAAASGQGAAAVCEPLPDMPSGRIAYTQVRDDGSTAIYLMKPDGTDRRCLVDTDGPDTAPTWSPDGRWVAFQGGTDAQQDLFVVRADGTGLRQLTDTPEWEEMPVWSPDGRRIAYGRSRVENEPPWSLRVMSADGSRDAQLLSSGHRFIWAELRDWSPDGRTLLIATDNGGGTDLVRMDPDGTHVRRLRSEAGDFGAGAAYSPDGRSLVFQADLDGGCIYRSDPDVRHLVRLTRGCSTGVGLTWSPDGTRILLAGGDGGGDLESIKPDGSERRTIVDTGDVSQPAWQPPTSG